MHICFEAAQAFFHDTFLRTFCGVIYLPCATDSMGSMTLISFWLETCGQSRQDPHALIRFFLSNQNVLRAYRDPFHVHVLVL